MQRLSEAFATAVKGVRITATLRSVVAQWRSHSPALCWRDRAVALLRRLTRLRCLVVKYRDEDDEDVNVDTEEDLEEALAMFFSIQKHNPAAMLTLKLFLQSDKSLKFSTQQNGSNAQPVLAVSPQREIHTGSPLNGSGSSIAGIGTSRRLSNPPAPRGSGLSLFIPDSNLNFVNRPTLSALPSIPSVAPPLRTPTDSPFTSMDPPPLRTPPSSPREENFTFATFRRATTNERSSNVVPNSNYDVRSPTERGGSALEVRSPNDAKIAETPPLRSPPPSPHSFGKPLTHTRARAVLTRSLC